MVTRINRIPVRIAAKAYSMTSLPQTVLHLENLVKICRKPFELSADSPKFGE